MCDSAASGQKSCMFKILTTALATGALVAGIATIVSAQSAPPPIVIPTPPMATPVPLETPVPMLTPLPIVTPIPLPT